ncbi:conserved hypothetical protein [delta proteobacterium NaphS2]|nr:conserved hypothetical protein [delta proteobacterium NaphS2]
MLLISFPRLVKLSCAGFSGKKAKGLERTLLLYSVDITMVIALLMSGEEPNLPTATISQK